MQVIQTISDLKAYHNCVLVPTMGALHKGHASLITQAVALQHPPVVVSIFVNPAQFAADEDLANYPQTLDADLALCEECGADAVFMPQTTLVYPNGIPTADNLSSEPLPNVATRPQLEDCARPTHFAGVCIVVRRLFDLTQPKYAMFGSKDFQQLAVIRAMVKIDQRPIQIVGCDTIREQDGLALSSRNVYLNNEQRKRALGISKALIAIEHIGSITAAEDTMCEILDLHHIRTEYAAIRDANTLLPIDTLNTTTQLQALIAGYIDKVRLIDNMHVNISPNNA